MIEINPVATSGRVSWDSVSRVVFYVMALLLPLMAWTLPGAPFVMAKSLLFYTGVALAIFFWFLSRLQKGELNFPKSALLLCSGGIVLVWLASSLFSDNVLLSLTGRGFEIDSFLFFLFAFFGLFLVSNLFQSERSALRFYLACFVSAIIVFVVQLANVFIKPFEYLGSKTGNLVGSWGDFGIFFGFILLVSVVLFELGNFRRWKKYALACIAAISLFAMILVNLYINWVILAFISLCLFVYLFYRSFYFPAVLNTENSFSHEMPILQRNNNYFLPLIVFILMIFFLLAKGPMGEITVSAGTNFVEVRPSWSTTMSIIGDTLKTDPILGTAPNTFLYNWLTHKPVEINNTIFWNARFNSGIGQLISMVSTTGIIGALALISFLGFLLYYGWKAFSYQRDDMLHALLIASFLGSVYLWIFAVCYTPGFAIMAMAFIVTGIFVALLVKAEKIKNINLSFLKNSRAGFVSVLVIVLLLIASVSSLYLLLKKGLASYYYAQGVKIYNSAGDLGQAETKVSKAINMDPQDEYYRYMVEINLLKIRQLLNSPDLPPEQAMADFQNILASAISNGQNATKFNSKDPLNWMTLGMIYEAVVPLKIQGADAMAVSSYQEASKHSPFDPEPFLASARVEIQNQNFAQAKTYLQSALSLKSDFVAALFLISQIEVYEGNLKEAIAKTEQTAMLVPNDVGVLFQLGLLYYQDNNLAGGRMAFERAISINQNYANARYFLGLIYDKQGLKEKAIEQFENIEKTNSDNQEIEIILDNLRNGKSALDGISPPQKAPEKRTNPPIKDKEPQS